MSNRILMNIRPLTAVSTDSEDIGRPTLQIFTSMTTGTVTDVCIQNKKAPKRKLCTEVNAAMKQLWDWLLISYLQHCKEATNGQDRLTLLRLRTWFGYWKQTHMRIWPQSRVIEAHKVRDVIASSCSFRTHKGEFIKLLVKLSLI